MKLTKDNELIIEGPSNLNKIIEGLIKAREQGLERWARFNGRTFYSTDATYDSIYQTIYGCTKEEFDKKIEKARLEFEEEKKKEEEKLKIKIPEWIERGKSLIHESKQKDWENAVKARAHDLYHGKEIEEALIVMKKLQENLTNEEMIELLKKGNHSGASANVVRDLVLHFSNKGPDFYEATALTLNEQEKKLLEQIRNNNKNNTK